MDRGKGRLKFQENGLGPLSPGVSGRLRNSDPGDPEISQNFIPKFRQNLDTGVWWAGRRPAAFKLLGIFAGRRPPISQGLGIFRGLGPKFRPTGQLSPGGGSGPGPVYILLRKSPKWVCASLSAFSPISKYSLAGRGQTVHCMEGGGG